VTDPHWLVKDFHVLYRAAEDALGQALCDRYKTAHLNELARQLGRLKFAFQACESERHGGSARLTEPERKALAALHRWLHSPVGDDMLIEEAQDYHGQVETEQGTAECERLQTEEREAYDALMREDAIEQARRGNS
jgi:hypothetical protein